MPVLLQQGPSLVYRLLSDADRQQCPRPALPGGRDRSLFHGPSGRRPFSRCGARPAPLPNLRTLRRRTTTADGACGAAVLGPPRACIEDARLVDAWARSTESVLRSEHERPVLGAASDHASLNRQGACATRSGTRSASATRRRTWPYAIG